MKITTAMLLSALSISCSSCIDLKCTATERVNFINCHTVIVKGRTFDVSTKQNAYAMRQFIHRAGELVFENISKANIQSFWNIYDFKAPDADARLAVFPALFSVRLGNGDMIPVWLGERSSYYFPIVDDIGLTVRWDADPGTIDFTCIDDCGTADVYIQVICDSKCSSCENIERILERFLQHGQGGHLACLMIY